MPCGSAAALQDGQIEVDDVPAGEDVGIELVDVSAKKRSSSARSSGKPRRRRAAPGPIDQHALAADAGEGDRIERGRIGVGLDVERQHPQRGREVGGRERRVPVDAADAAVRLPGAVDRDRAADVAIDQVAVGEAQVRLEASDAGGARGDGGAAGTSPGSATVDARDRRRRRALAARSPRRGAGRGDEPLAAAGTKKYGPDAIVDDEKRLAVLEHAVEMDLGTAADDAIGRVQDEAAHLVALAARCRPRNRLRLRRPLGSRFGYM